MPSRRIARLNEQFKRELMDVMQREVRDPRVHGVTITTVVATPDLDRARVYVTTLAQGDERDAILAGLDAARPFLRRELSRRLRIRRAPELDFAWDETLDHARRIEKLLAQVRPPIIDPQAAVSDPDATVSDPDAAAAADEDSETGHPPESGEPDHDR